MKQPEYRIYPSLLDKFQAYLDSEQEADSFYNTDQETGEQKLTADEIADRHERELLDTINRVPREPSEYADKGTCFNEIVDRIIEHRKDGRADVKVETLRDSQPPASRPRWTASTSTSTSRCARKSPPCSRGRYASTCAAPR